VIKVLLENQEMMVFQDLQVTQDLAEIQAKMELLDQLVFLGP